MRGVGLALAPQERATTPSDLPVRSDACICALNPALRKERTGKRNADKRCATTSAPPPSSSPACGGGREGARHRPHPYPPPPRGGGHGRGRLACRRSTTALAAATERHRSASATRLPGTWSARAPRWFERRARRNALGPDGPDRSRHRGRYPRLPVPVQRDCTRSPVMMPAGRVLPKPPGSTGDEPMPAGTAPAPPAGVAG